MKALLIPMLRARLASPGAAAALRVLLLGTLVSLLLSAYIGYWEQRGVHDEIRDLAAERTELLASTMRVSMQVLYSLQSLHAAQGGIEPAAFGLFARDARERHPELQALEWVPQVRAGERSAFEQAMQKAGRVGYHIHELVGDRVPGQPLSASDRDVYFPVQLIEPLAGNEAAEGLDMAADARRRIALEHARSSGQPAATAPVRLAQETGNQSGFLVFLPLYQTSGNRSAANADLEGFALAVFRCDDLIRHAMRGMDGRGFGIAVYDISDGPAQRMYGPDADAAAPWLVQQATWLLPVLPWRNALSVAGRRWQLVLTPQAGFIMQHLPWQTVAVLLGSLLFTALVASLVYGTTRRNAEIARTNAALQLEITRREQAVQEALAASQSKSSFLANMSHEIRTPMNAVLGYAQLLRRDARLDDTQREAVNAILSSGNHLMNQINEVLDFSKIESGRLELNRSNFDVNAMLRDLEIMFQPRCLEKRLALNVTLLSPAEAWVFGDSVKVQQILINLLGNAVRFTSVGEVALRARIAGPGADPGVYRFDVIDTGPGIAPDEHERIFEAFYQTPLQSHSNAGGSGLGLAIARRRRTNGWALVAGVRTGSRLNLFP